MTICDHKNHTTFLDAWGQIKVFIEINSLYLLISVIMQKKNIINN